MNIRKVAVVTAAAVALLAVGHNTNVYDGLNKGITFGSCGVEVVGHPGLFCGDDSEVVVQSQGNAHELLWSHGDRARWVGVRVFSWHHIPVLDIYTGGF